MARNVWEALNGQKWSGRLLNGQKWFGRLLNCQKWFGKLLNAICRNLEARNNLGVP